MFDKNLVENVIFPSFVQSDFESFNSSGMNEEER